MIDNFWKPIRLEYKGFSTKIRYSVQDKCYYGKLEDIRDLVLYDADTPEDIEQAFHEAVDEYLEYRSAI